MKTVPAKFVSASCFENLGSRISSDTQVVQDGLTTGFAMFCKSSCICIGMIVIMFTYSWQLTIYALILTAPSLFSTFVFFSISKKYNMRYQKAKADMSSVASEYFGNIRTVKAFADEMGASNLYAKHNWKTY
jgi:ATP-binding cassette subfamily B multidrug efflux pump